MKLFWCVALCLSTVSAYSLVQPGTDTDQVLRESPVDAPPHRLLDGASLAKLMKYLSAARAGTSLAGPHVPHTPGRVIPGAQSSSLSSPSVLLGLFRHALWARGVPDQVVDTVIGDVFRGLSYQAMPVAEISDHDNEHLDDDDDDGDDHGLPEIFAKSEAPSSASSEVYSKRGYPRRRGFKPRFAPKFGTKLIPNQKNGNGGPTLLRYGRSAGGVEIGQK